MRMTPRHERYSPGLSRYAGVPTAPAGPAMSRELLNTQREHPKTDNEKQRTNH
jgi:hypothetical protein